MVSPINLICASGGVLPSGSNFLPLAQEENETILGNYAIGEKCLYSMLKTQLMLGLKTLEVARGRLDQPVTKNLLRFWNESLVTPLLDVLIDTIAHKGCLDICNLQKLFLLKVMPLSREDEIITYQGDLTIDEIKPRECLLDCGEDEIRSVDKLHSKSQMMQSAESRTTLLRKSTLRWVDICSEESCSTLCIFLMLEEDVDVARQEIIIAWS